MYSNYFLRRPLVRQNIPRRTSYPLGYCGNLGNFPFVVLGVDDDERKLPAIDKNYNEADDNEEPKKKAQERTAVDDYLQSLTVRTEMLESAGPYAEIWQQSACAWDRKQTRYNQFRVYDAQRNGEKNQNECERSTAAKFDLTRTNYCQRTCFKDPLTGKEVRFTKPMVGFGGFVPRYPVLPRPQERCSNPGLISISKTTYKLYPSYEYKKQEFAHKGPLSSAVTTTPPFNPYNKVEKLSLDGKKLLWKRQNHIIKLAKMKKIYK